MGTIDAYKILEMPFFTILPDRKSYLIAPRMLRL